MSKEKALYITFFILGVFPLLPFRLKPAGVVALSILGLFAFTKNKKFSFNRIYLNNATIFLAYLISFFLSSNKLYAYKYLETSLAIIIFPLAFSLISGLNFSKDFILKIETFFYKVFYTSSVIYAIFIFIYIKYLGYFSDKVSYSYTLSYISNMFWGFGEDLIYTSISLVFSLFFSIKLIKTYPKYRLLLLLSNLILLLALVYLSRKGVIIAGIISFLYIIFKVNNSLKFKVFITASAFISILSFYLLFPNSVKRVNELFNIETYTKPVDVNNSTSIRLQIYKCAYKNISRAGLLGFGIGDVNNEMYKCYQKNSPEIAQQRLGTHNVYLNVLLGQGYLGFILFAIILFNLFKFSVKRKNVIFTAIILFYLIEFLTENVLNRQNGVLLFSFLINFMAYLTLNTQKTINEE